MRTAAGAAWAVRGLSLWTHRAFGCGGTHDSSWLCLGAGAVPLVRAARHRLRLLQLLHRPRPLPRPRAAGPWCSHCLNQGCSGHSSRIPGYLNSLNWQHGSPSTAAATSAAETLASAPVSRHWQQVSLARTPGRLESSAAVSGTASVLGMPMRAGAPVGLPQLRARVRPGRHRGAAAARGAHPGARVPAAGPALHQVPPGAALPQFSIAPKLAPPCLDAAGSWAGKPLEQQAAKCSLRMRPFRLDGPPAERLCSIALACKLTGFVSCSVLASRRRHREDAAAGASALTGSLSGRSQVLRGHLRRNCDVCGGRAGQHDLRGRGARHADGAAQRGALPLLRAAAGRHRLAAGGAGVARRLECTGMVA